jgi:hypothetical protein
MHRDWASDASDSVDDPNVTEVAESDLFAVGRYVRRAGKADRLLIGRRSCLVEWNERNGQSREKYGVEAPHRCQSWG